MPQQFASLEFINRKHDELHMNNCANVEAEIQKFLSTLTPLALSVEGAADIADAAVDVPHGPNEKLVRMRDKLRLLCKPFVPKLYTDDHDDDFKDNSGGRRDILDYFPRITPYATTNRHRIYGIDDAATQHPDIQNPSRLEEMVDKLELNVYTSLLDPVMIRPCADTDSDYLALRVRQNDDWATSSIATGRDLMAAGNLDKAVSAFSHALEINPKSTVAMLELANLHLKMKRFPLAVKNCERVLLEVDPLNDDAFQLLMTVVEQGRLDDYKKSTSFQSILDKRLLAEQSLDSRHDERWPIIPEPITTTNSRPLSRESTRYPVNDHHDVYRPNDRAPRYGEPYFHNEPPGRNDEYEGYGAGYERTRGDYRNFRRNDEREFRPQPRHTDEDDSTLYRNNRNQEYQSNHPVRYQNDLNGAEQHRTYAIVNDIQNGQRHSRSKEPETINYD